MPGVEADVVVIAASGNESRIVAQALLQLEAEHPAVEVQGPIDVGDFEMDVADVDTGVDRDVVGSNAACRGLACRGCGGSRRQAGPAETGLLPRPFSVQDHVDEAVGIGVVIAADAANRPALESAKGLLDLPVEA